MHMQDLSMNNGYNLGATKDTVQMVLIRRYSLRIITNTLKSSRNTLREMGFQIRFKQIVSLASLLIDHAILTHVDTTIMNCSPNPSTSTSRYLFIHVYIDIGGVFCNLSASTSTSTSRASCSCCIFMFVDSYYCVRSCRSY